MLPKRFGLPESGYSGRLPQAESFARRKRALDAAPELLTRER